MTARLMIGAPSGRCGKTTITVGICASLKKRGLVVQPFKKGPDYIDPSWLTAASGRSCRNLDLFMMKKDTVMKNFYDSTVDTDIAVIEANMGFYDCVNPDGRDSPANLARLINAPVILVINCSRMTRSVAAIVKGFLEFEPDNHIKGVILNNVSGQRHEKKLIDNIKKYCHIPVLGILPRSSSLGIEERHLGLIHFKEDEYGENIISHIADFVERHIDMDRIISIAKNSIDKKPYKDSTGTYKKTKIRQKVKIGIFYDKAFSFYYPENLEALETRGAGLVFIDSMKDRLIQDIDGLYIGGGFPELYGSEIAKNYSLLKQVRGAIENWMPVYSECAGLMYLSKGIKTNKGFFEMSGVIPSSVEIKTRPQGHGYMEVEVIGENPFFKKGTKIRGHEFHYSRLSDNGHLYCILKVKRGHGIDGYLDGILYKNMFASYMHIHASCVPGWAERFIQMAIKYKHGYFKTENLDHKGVYYHGR
ncbi:MAG: hydrogenobyrinic acid a,c-diamide synthase (glutamine-hydrolyzing) [Syntrophorhabdaceae bacterium]|nr:hydrogenobyrinic acid a,c-diamide synthase (glutamine-hydrolyzing) [Syntrophorhabdaceae bacterium]